MMKRHLARQQNDIDRPVQIEAAENCGAPAQNVCLLRFFHVFEGPRVSSRQNTEAAIVDRAICQRYPRGNQSRF